MSRTAPASERTEAITRRPGAAKPAGGPTPVPAYPFLLPPAADGELGRLGNYRVLRLLGRGGMGMVFAAEDVALRRPVSLKVMNPELAVDPFHWQRFLREARSLAAIKHKHLVTVYQAAQDGETVYLVMELLEGESLEGRLARDEPADVREVTRIGREIAAGLAVLHDHGLIHRDIKPANIWLEETRNAEPAKPDGSGARGRRGTPHVKILDLGLVQDEHAEMQLTEAGMVVGTPAYMSPEQARGRPLDARTDLFSLGCILFALCTGRPPFDADTPMAQAAALAADDPPSVCELNPAVPASLSDLIAQLLAKNPDARPATAAEVAARLRAIGRDLEAGKSSPRRKYRAATAPAAAPPRPFYRRHGVKLVAGLWLVVLALAAVAVSLKGKNEAKPPGQTAGTEPPANSDVVFLSDLKPLRAEGWPLPVPPPGTDGSVVVGGRRSPHGLFMHPLPPHEGTTRVSYRLGKAYTRFTARVAINDRAPPRGEPVTFLVQCDDREPWKSPEMVARGEPVPIDIDVRGVDVLTIGVVTRGDVRGAHSVWVEPRLTK